MAKKILSDNNIRILKSGLKGGAGGALKQAVTNKTYGQIDSAAQKASARLSRKGKTSNADPVGNHTTKQKMDGPLFYLMMCFTILDDVMDIALNATFVLSIAATILSLIISFMVFTYLYSENINWNTRKLIMWSISFIIEIIPFLSILPTYTIIFALTKKLENNPSLITKASQLKNKNITRPKRG